MKREKFAALAISTGMIMVLAGCSQDGGDMAYATKDGKPPASMANAAPGDLVGSAGSAVGPGGSAADGGGMSSAGNAKKRK